MRRLLTLTFISATLAQAQDLKTLQAAMRSLQETLSRQTHMKWTQTPAGSDVKPYTMIETLSNIAVDPGACTVSFKTDRATPEYHYQLALAWTLPVRDIGEIVTGTVAALSQRSASKPPHSGGVTTDPEVFVVQITAAPDRKFPAHRRSLNSENQVIEKDQTQSSASISFGEEATAREAARELQKVKDLCTQ